MMPIIRIHTVLASLLIPFSLIGHTASAQTRLTGRVWEEFRIAAARYDSLQTVFKALQKEHPALGKNPLLMQDYIKQDLPAIMEIYQGLPQKASAALENTGDIPSYGIDDLRLIALAAATIQDHVTAAAANERLLALVHAPDSQRTIRRELAMLSAALGDADKAMQYATRENLVDASDMERGVISSAVASALADEERPVEAHAFAISAVRGFRAYKDADSTAEEMPSDPLQREEIEKAQRYFIITHLAEPLANVVYAYRASGDTSGATRFLHEAETVLDDSALLADLRSATEAYVEKKTKERELIDRPAPEWGKHRWIGTDGLSLTKLAGKVVLVDFFATWCKPCIMAFPHIRKWKERYASEGLVVVGLTQYQGRYEGIQLPADSEYAKLKNDFVHKHHVTWPVGIAEAGSSTFKDYHVGGIPHIVLIDRKGVIRYFAVGAGQYERTERQIRKLLRKKAG
ncbi:MAG: TlpA disulfide reductase family protein [Bacteroidota bacterium]|nr:TlpA disulfide reductase family protein [Bacteroidota bacterium]